MLLDSKNTKEVDSSRHEGESSSSESSERSEDNDEDDYGTGSKENSCYGAGNCDDGGDSNTGAGGYSA